MFAFTSSKVCKHFRPTAREEGEGCLEEGPVLGRIKLDGVSSYLCSICKNGIQYLKIYESMNLVCYLLVCVSVCTCVCVWRHEILIRLASSPTLSLHYRLFSRANGNPLLKSPTHWRPTVSVSISISVSALELTLCNGMCVLVCVCVKHM